MIQQAVYLQFNFIIDRLSVLNSVVLDLQHEQVVEIYPNPSTGLINIEMANDLTPLTISITDGQGQLVHLKELERTSLHQVDLGTLTPGIYYVQVLNEKNRIAKKVIIQ